MPRLHGKDMTIVNVDDSGGTPVVLLAETISIGTEVGADTEDTSTLGDQWHEFTTGLKGGNEFSHELFYGSGAAGTWLTMTGRLGISGTLTVSDGTRTWAAETIITKVSDPVNVASMRKITVTHKINGAVSFS